MYYIHTLELSNLCMRTLSCAGHVFWHWLTFEVHDDVCVGGVSQSVGCLRWWPGFTYRKQQRVAFERNSTVTVYMLCVPSFNTAGYPPTVPTHSTRPQYLPRRRYTNTQNMPTNMATQATVYVLPAHCTCTYRCPSSSP